MFEKPLLIETADGSFTFSLPTQKVTYRSKYGARRESQQVFLGGSQILKQSSSPWRIVELGFGTGMNFLETARACFERKVALEYVSFENKPLGLSELESVISANGYQDESASELVRAVFSDFEYSQKDRRIKARDRSLSLELCFCNWGDIDFGQDKFDTVYFDPFGPKSQADSWGPSAFAYAFSLLRVGGTLVTYSSAGQVQRLLKSVGFGVQKLPGPAGKREVLVAHRI